jgi:PAS domain S-box-containing protein
MRVTLSSIGDAVVTTDARGRVTFLNPVAQSLTGWTQEGAAGVSLESVFKIVNEETRRTVENPAIRALREGVVLGLANHTLLIAKDGTEIPIDDSAAPIRNASGEVAGVVLVFRDVSERRRAEQSVQDTLDYCESIIATLREPFLIIDKNLRVKTANQCFYETFHVSPEKTENRFIYDLGNRQWDIPQFRMLLEECLGDNHLIHDFEVEHDFQSIGRKVMRLNARRLQKPDDHSDLILLAIEDITEDKHAEDAIRQRTAQFETLLNEAPLGVYLIGEDFRLRQVNPTALPAFGDISDLIGRDFDEVMHILWSKAKADEIVKRFRHTLETGEPHIVPELIEERHDRGVTEYYEWQINRIPLPDNRHGVVCYFRDISTRVLAQKKIRDSEERYRTLFNSIDEGFCVIEVMLDEQGKPDDIRYLETNPAFEQQTGLVRAEGKTDLQRGGA